MEKEAVMAQFILSSIHSDGLANTTKIARTLDTMADM
jgi:hypothetical protein